MTSTISENISLEDNKIRLTADYAGSDLLEYIEKFCNNNQINYKYVGEAITIYPADYNNLNDKRIDLSTAYVQLIAWQEVTSYECGSDDFIIDSMYWIDIDEEIHCFKDLDTLLLKIRDTKQVSSAYYTEAELFDIKLAREQTRIAHKRKELKKVSKFQSKLEKYGMTEKKFLKLQELYIEQKNISVA
jgi:hypothetical protein